MPAGMRIRILSALTVATLSAGCAGPTPTQQPTQLPTTSTAAAPPTAVPPTVAPTAVPATATTAPTLAPTALPPTATALSAPESLAIFQQGMQADDRRYQFALDQGARFVTAPDGRSFAIVWYPPGVEPATAPVIATLHGHGSYAFDEFFLWQSYALDRGYGIIALQWWFGTGEQMDDYYLPHEIYEAFAAMFLAERVQPGTVLFHGFSRGSANAYGVVAIDASLERPYFGLSIANAGKPGTDFPINVDIQRGKFGSAPFAATHWVMVCGQHDPHPDRDGCPGMREARDWVTTYGGVVDLLIEDPDGDHGAFHKNPANVNAALDVFATRLEATED